MSVLVTDIINDAALEMGDPNKERVTLPHWISIFNRSMREMCSKANVYKTQDAFTLDAVTSYTWPQHMTVCTGIEISETPDDETTFRSLHEMFEDEFRAATTGNFPTGTPDSYFATSSFFYLVPMAVAEIEGGGVITHFGIPDASEGETVTESTLDGFTLLTPDFTADYVMRRMIIFAQFARNRYAEAREGLALWEQDVPTIGDKMEDRAIDRRSAIRPVRNRLAGMR